jgi:hypothetical protein
VVHSTVGLDPQLRGQAERLLVGQMRDPEKSLRHRTGIAWAVLELAEAGSASQRESVAVIAQGWAAEEEYEFLAAWEERLLARAGLMLPAEATGLLTQALEKEKGPPARYRLAEALASAAGRLGPVEASRVCAPAARILTQALVNTVPHDSSNLEEDGPRELAGPPLAQGLVLVAGRLEPVEAARVLREALQKEMSVMARRVLAAGLMSVAGRPRLPAF